MAMSKKTLTFLLTISSICSLIYVGFLFTPYFIDRNEFTGAINHVVIGYYIGFGHKGSSDINIIGNKIALICQLAGVIAFILLVCFLFTYPKNKKDSPWMYFTFALSIPFDAFALFSLFLAWPMYMNLNANKSDYADFTPFYYISLICLIVTLLINIFLLIFFALYRGKNKSEKKVGS